jgi:plasmid stabilization system protein ParE
MLLLGSYARIPKSLQYAGPYRRLLVRDFPYGIFYQAQANRIVVVAIMDRRQDPKSIRRKLFGREDA